MFYYITCNSQTNVIEEKFSLRDPADSNSSCIETSEEVFNSLSLGDKINPETMEIIERAKVVKPEPSELEMLQKENEVLNDKVENLKEAIFELSLYTLKD